MKNVLCLLGFHKFGRPTYGEHRVTMSDGLYLQRLGIVDCLRCPEARLLTTVDPLIKIDHPSKHS